MQKKTFLLILTVASTLYRCDGPGPRENTGVPDKPPAAVEAVTVTKGLINKEIQSSGVVAGINEAYAVSETQGIIKRVGFDLGDKVARGQVLVKVDDRIARLNMEQAKKQYETDSMNLGVTEKLFREGSASKAEYIRIQSAANGGRAAYESALKTYEDCTIRAPIGGYVATREPTVTLGNYLAAGLRVARIVDISSLKLEVAVGEREVSFIEEGAASIIQIPAACQQKVFEGKVKAVAAGADPATGSYTTVVTWENTCDNRVKSGMSATAVIRTRREEPSVIVPTAAITSIEMRDAVFTVVKDRAAVRFVRTGRRIGNRTEILEGLDEGATIILSGLAALAKGDRVQPTIIGESGTWQ